MKLFVQQFMQRGTKMGPATLLRAAYTSSAVVVTCHKTWSPAATGAIVPAMSEALTQLELQKEDASLRRQEAVGSLSEAREDSSPRLQEVCSCWGVVLPSEGAAGGGQHTAYHQRGWERDRLVLLWEPAASRTQITNCCRRVCACQVGKWKFLWWQRLEAGHFRHQEEGSCYRLKFAITQQIDCPQSWWGAGSVDQWGIQASWSWAIQQNQEKTVSDSSGRLPGETNRGPHLLTWSVI